jgi:cobalt-zinc-cadmium efflux system outer membrane protein
LAFYDENIPHLRATLASLEKLYNERSLLLSELLRIKSLLLSLESGKQDLLNRINQIEGDLQVLLNDTTKSSRYYIPAIREDNRAGISTDTLSFTDLLDRALDNRPDIKMANLAVTYEKNNLSYQKSLAIPDVYLGANYSRSGSYISDYFGLSVQVDLPFLNRNQGNVEISKNTLESNRLALHSARLSLQRDVETSLKKAREADRVYHSLDTLFRQQYASLVAGTIANYQKRNITVIEFTDFWESYRNVALQCLQVENNRIDAMEELNFIVGADLFHE